jgi:CheY-like chemotaxis protein
MDHDAHKDRFGAVHPHCRGRIAHPRNIARFLESEGCAVLEAANGEEAVAYLENGHMIDVVFTDIRLGLGLNGWDVGEAFRAERPASSHCLYFG